MMFEDGMDNPFASRFVFDQASRSKSNLSSQVYMEVLGRLQRGELTSDDRVVDTALAAELSISRMPVREALLRLAHEGYLVSTTRGFMLPKLSHQDVAEIYEIRLLLEPRAAASAARVLSDRSIALLEEAQQAVRGAAARHDPKEFMMAGDRFRLVWLQAVPNKRLAATILRFVDQIQTVHRGTLYNENSRRIAVRLSDQLFNAFKERDPLAVYERLAIFLDRGREEFFLLSPHSGTEAGEIDASSSA